MMAHRLRTARAQFVLQHPFLGVLLLRLAMRPDEQCRSIATDGTEIHYQPALLTDLSPGDIQFHLTHQVLHCASAIRGGAATGSRPCGTWRATTRSINCCSTKDSSQSPAHSSTSADNQTPRTSCRNCAAKAD